MRRINSIIRKELTELGFYDITAFGHSRFSKDLFGLWDFVAKEKHRDGFNVVFIQAKTGYAPSEDKEEMRKFCQLGGVMGLLAEWVPKQVKYARKKGSYTKHELKITRW